MALSEEAVRTLRERALLMHKEHRGKTEIISKVPLRDADDLSLAYTPGVAEPCKVIEKDLEAVYEYTSKGNTIAVLSDGSAVLGLGDIGPEAGLPVMEGKSVLFKYFGGVDAFPIVIRARDPQEIIGIGKALEPSFGGINMEDISAPRCFEIEQGLKSQLQIPVMHDDQHATAIVSTAGLLNALKIVGKDIDKIKVVVNGAGASGIATAKLLMMVGVKNVVLCDTKGAIYEGRQVGMNPWKEEIARMSNPEGIKGDLAAAARGADVLIGLSAAGAFTHDMVASMNKDGIVMAMANPTPEIFPDDAQAAGAKVVCTGRSDFPNQINNVLAFPGIFRGALDVRAKEINEEMKLAAARAIASLVSDSELRPDYVIPTAFDPRVAPAVAAAVAGTAVVTGAARLVVDPEIVAERTRRLVERIRSVPPIGGV